MQNQGGMGMEAVAIGGTLFVFQPKQKQNRKASKEFTLSVYGFTAIALFVELKMTHLTSNAWFRLLLRTTKGENKNPKP